MPTFTVPATTANLGPGFDCLGLALDLWNEAAFWIEPGPGGEARVEIEGFGAKELPRDGQNLTAQAAFRAWERAGFSPRGRLRVRCSNRFPPASGLGSSSAAIVLGLLGGNALAGAPLSDEEILSLAVELEGHPDNVTPALAGGLTVTAITGRGRIAFRKVDPAPVHAAVCVPPVALSTAAARAALPKMIPLPDAVFNLSHTALVVEAFRAGDFDLLREAMSDRLHQPYRLPLIPGAEEALRRAHAVGFPAALSGAGPGVIAFAPDEAGARTAAAAMAAAFGGQVWTWVGRAAGAGAHPVGEPRPG